MVKGLYKKLPPFAPDYSGVCSVLFELGGLVVVHDAGGCTGNITCYDEPRWYGNSSATLSSELREIEAVWGDDGKLIGKIEKAEVDLKRRFLAILGSPAPMVIGTDYGAIATSLAKKTNLPVLAFDTNGMKYYDEGISMAFLELAKKFTKPFTATKDKVVNIIGATPLDIGNERHMEELTLLLGDAGCREVCCWSMGSTLEKIEQGAQASLNIVVSYAGLETARYMQNQYNIPYIVGLPIGREATRRFLTDVRLLLGLINKEDTCQKTASPPLDKRTALVIGEQVRSNSLRNYLRMDKGINKVTVASYFGMDESLLEAGDISLKHEDDLTMLMKKQHFDLIIGDPLYQELMPTKEICFLEFPHIAVSSRLHWDNELEYIGDYGASLLELLKRKEKCNEN